jgi:hypothetical protein
MFPVDALAVGPGGDAYTVAARQVWRVAPDGTVSALGPLPGGATLVPSDLALDGEGRVVVYGHGGPAGSPPGDVVARFGADLGLDPTFGTGGLVTLPGASDPTTSYVRGVHAAGDGTVTVVQQVSTTLQPDLVVHRLLPSGAPDPAFNGDGRVEGALRLADDPGWVYASALVGSDVVMVGTTDTGALTARLNG